MAEWVTFSFLIFKLTSRVHQSKIDNLKDNALNLHQVIKYNAKVLLFDSDFIISLSK